MADLRKCLGSARFGIEAHDAPAEDFPVQPSQKGGLGRMCKPHWRQYTAGLARDAKARRAAADATPDRQPVTRRRRPDEPEPIRTRPPRKARETAPAAAELAQDARAE